MILYCSQYIEPAYRNPYRRDSAIALPRSHTWPRSEYNKNYQTLQPGHKEESDISRSRDNLHYEGLSFSGKTELQHKYVKHSAKKQESKNPVNQLEYTGLNFSLGTEAGEYRKVSGRTRRDHGVPRGELRYDGLDFHNRSETKSRFVEKPVEGFVQLRPNTNIELVDKSLDDTTEFLDAYRAKFGRRAATTGTLPRNKIVLNNILENQTHPMVNQRPKTVGFLDYSSETSLQYSARFGRRAKLQPEKVQKFTMRSNLKSPGPEIKFTGSSEQQDNFTAKPIVKTEKKYHTHVANIKTFDTEYLKHLQTNDQHPRYINCIK